MSSSYIAIELRQKVRVFFEACCAYCHTPESLTIAIYEIEHIVPRINGGESVFENLCFACPTCNRYKGTRQFVPDDVTGKPTALFHPHAQRWSEHFAWSDDATVLLAKTDTARVTIDVLRINRPELVRLRKMWVRLDKFPPDLEVDK